MKKALSDIIHIKSIGEHHRLAGFPKPLHPLVSILKFQDIQMPPPEATPKFTLDFYTVTIKKDCDCKTKYGQTHYDFDEGVMSFLAPEQVLGIEENFVPPSAGWMLVFHPDFIRNYPLGNKIKEYGFFDYGMNEALILSEAEEQSMEQIFENIDREYHLPIDSFSQDVIISQIELLLTYSNRYYHRQFNTRKKPTNDLLSKLETLLNDYFKGENMRETLPTVSYLAEQLQMSPKYLSDALHTSTGKSAQQHIHDKLIEKAKQILSGTNLSVSEIAYQLGFEYPQSFSKLFKKKTNLSPLEFRQSFN